MIKKILFLLLLTFAAHASKLSDYLHKAHAREQARLQQEWQQDMNFKDLYFRRTRAYVNNNGYPCREYEFRSRSNPYRFGLYQVCEQRPNFFIGR